MLTALGYGMVVAFMALIMTRRLSPLVALIAVPLLFGGLAGFGADMGPMVLEGIAKLAPTAVMLMFAILYFAVMIDAGLFEPFVARVVRLVQGDPARVVVGNAALALLVSLDGDGSTTYMITTAAMLPLYRRLGMRPLVLACVTMLASGVMNILPWGGPTARAASALAVDVGDVFVPMIPAMLGGAAWVLYMAWRLGLAERRRLAAAGGAGPVGPSVLLAELAHRAPFDVPDRAAGHPGAGPGAASGPGDRADDGAAPAMDDGAAHRRPDRMAFNAVLTALLLVGLVTAAAPLPVLFMVAFAVAVVANYPAVDAQKALLARHAGNVLAVVGVIFAAGVFIGVLSGTKMVDAIAHSVVRLVPEALGPWLAVVTALLSIPFTFFISNDAFYFGVLPILAKAGEAYGIPAVEMARASLIGQPVHLLSPLVPSTFLLVGLAGVEFDEHQRYTVRWALVTSAVLLAMALVTGVVGLRAG